MEKSFIEVQKARILASFNTDEGSAELRKAEIIDIEKGRKVAFVGEKRVFGGRNYIKTKDGWKYHGKGTGQKRVAPATDHLVVEGGKHYMDVLDPDSGAKMFKPGDKVKYEDDSGKKYEGTISSREHPEGDMFEVDFKEVGVSKEEEPKKEESTKGSI